MPSVEAVERVPKQIFERDAEENDLTKMTFSTGSLAAKELKCQTLRGNIIQSKISVPEIHC
jgi:hypothetical protein